jgi:hypothetical protein
MGEKGERKEGGREEEEEAAQTSSRRNYGTPPSVWWLWHLGEPREGLATRVGVYGTYEGAKLAGMRYKEESSAERRMLIERIPMEPDASDNKEEF